MTTHPAPQQSESPEHSSRTELPTTGDLIQISKLLKDEPIPKLLSSQKHIPKLLLTAARKGITEDPTSEISGTKALVDSLLSLSKTSIIAKKRNQNLRKPSPFGKTRAAHIGNIEMDTITRTSTWATSLLTESVRGVPTDATSHPPIARIAHRDNTAVFVAPRDTIDPVLAQRYATQATHCLDRSFFRNNLTALTNLQAFLMSSAASSHRHINIYLPVFERALHIFASTPCPLLASEYSSGTLEHALEQSSTSPKPIDLLALLLPQAKAMLCVQSPLFRTSMREHIQRVFASRNIILYSAERETVNPLARAAATDINFHWQLMDDVRTLVSGHEAPFSLKLWSHRRFFRALFSETLLLIEKGDTHHVNHENLVKRFPPFGRPVMRLIAHLSASFRSPDIRRQRRAVSMTGKLLWKVLNLDGDIVWSLNVHAMMICAESLFEMFCWAATFSLKLDRFNSMRPKKRKQSPECDPLTCVCYLSALMETSRLPGGELVETKMQLRSTALSTRDFLLKVYRKRQLNCGAASREKRLSGLGVYALSGILGRQDLELSVKSWGPVPLEDKENLSRGLEKSTLWASDVAARSRYERYLKQLAELVS